MPPMGKSIEVRGGIGRIFIPELRDAYGVIGTYVVGEVTSGDNPEHTILTYTIPLDRSVTRLVESNNQAILQTIGINGKLVEDPEAPLLYILRYELGRIKEPDIQLELGLRNPRRNWI